MSEIPNAPISRHDIEAIRDALIKSGVREYLSDEDRTNQEIVLSSRRVSREGHSGLKVLGIPVRVNDHMPLNQFVLIRPGRAPLTLSFEEA